MLEGLEVSEVSKKVINEDNEEFRLDADYYKKEYINLYNLIDDGEHLANIASMSDLSSNASFATVSGIVHDNNPKVIPFIRSGNVGNTFINLNGLEYISKEAHEQLNKSITKLYDVMMARKGKIGGASIIMESEVNFNCNENVIKLTLNDKKSINPFYFTVFFNSKFGIKQVERLSTGNVQPWVPISQLRKLYFKNASIPIQNSIEKVILNSYDYLSNSQYLYTEAENILLEELGLNNWQPTIKNNNTKTLKESFLSSGRIDAEYYQPKYDEIEEKIINYKGGFDQVKNICNLKTQNFQPQDDVIYNYIELANIGSNGVIKDVTLNEGKDLPSRARRIVKTNDVIVSSVEGSLASCAIIPKEFNNAICSTGFYVINSKNINSETLLLLFKTAVIHLMEKGCSGTILTAINNEEFFKIPLPTIDENIQKTISDKIQQSFALQSKSKQLLEAAKKAVEMAIEQNEEMAMDYLKVIETNIEYATTKSTPSYAHFSELQ